jgi:penicillin-insensitive murein endopeptidase
MTTMKTLFFILTLTCTSPLFSSEPVGTNNEGSLIDGVPLPERGEGYIHMYHNTNRFWGTEELINMIEATALDMEKKYPGRDRLQVEDLGFKAGGEISRHASHENGLDADIGYYKSDEVEHDPIAKNQVYSDPMVVKEKVIANFDVERNWELMKTLHRHGDVQKIFVDGLLKKAMCAHAKKVGDYSNHLQVLRSLRHEVNHQDHLHVRIRCPKEAKKCVNQKEPVKEIGC